MNLRISQGQLRFRITRGELAQLLANCTVQLALPLSTHPRHYRIQTEESEYPLMLKEDEHGVTLTANRSMLVDFANHLPSREGIEHKITLNDEECLLVLEVDVRKSPQ